MMDFVLRFITRLHLFLALMTIAPLGMAYIGPGSGISVVGSLLGLLVTILITVGAIALFPFRRMLKNRRQKDSTENADEGIDPQMEAKPLDTLENEGVETK